MFYSFVMFVMMLVSTVLAYLILKYCLCVFIDKNNILFRLLSGRQKTCKRYISVTHFD